MLSPTTSALMPVVIPMIDGVIKLTKHWTRFWETIANSPLEQAISEMKAMGLETKELQQSLIEQQIARMEIDLKGAKNKKQLELETNSLIKDNIN